MNRQIFIDNTPLYHVLFCDKCSLQQGNGCVCALFSDHILPYATLQTNEEVVFYDNLMGPLPPPVQYSQEELREIILRNEHPLINQSGQNRHAGITPSDIPQ